MQRILFFYFHRNIQLQYMCFNATFVEKRGCKISC